jgi:Flp pilus assembly pilin Flp
MKNAINAIRRQATAWFDKLTTLSKVEGLHRDQQGADTVEYILIVAAIALPLLAVVIWFRKDIWEFVKVAWTSIRGRSTVNTSNP